MGGDFTNSDAEVFSGVDACGEVEGDVGVLSDEGTYVIGALPQLLISTSKMVDKRIVIAFLATSALLCPAQSCKGGLQSEAPSRARHLLLLLHKSRQPHTHSGAPCGACVVCPGLMP